MTLHASPRKDGAVEAIPMSGPTRTIRVTTSERKTEGSHRRRQALSAWAGRVSTGRYGRADPAVPGGGVRRGVAGGGNGAWRAVDGYIQPSSFSAHCAFHTLVIRVTLSSPFMVKR